MAKKDLTAAIIIVGDEILKGHVQDANSPYLCKQLWGLGVQVCRIVVVPDDLGAIAQEVRGLSPLYDYVITSGGMGPTHDDVTMEAMGRAFSEDLAPHPDILRFLFPKDPESPAHRSHPWWKMAMVPTSTRIHVPRSSSDKGTEEAVSFVLMVVHNVHCYPGVPSLLRSIFTKCKDLYRGSSLFFLKEVFFSCDEDVLTRPLTCVQEEHPTVQVGSYPDYTSENSYSVRVALESRHCHLVEKAFSQLVLSLPLSSIMSSRCSYGCHDNKSTEARQFMANVLSLSQDKASLLPDSLCLKIHESAKTLQKALEEYSLSGMCVAFNGGKDCTVILALLRAILTHQGAPSSKIPVLYVAEGDQFPEVKEFFFSTVKRVGLDVVEIPGGIRQALSQLKDRRPELKAVCMGTRRTDPHSADLEAFSMTDDSWPQYMRVNSILEWTYQDIWLFLRLCEIPYCKLYDNGYTSLDGVADTHPNPTLLTAPSATNAASSDHTPPSAATSSYLPAYMLKDQSLERMGRTSHSPNPNRSSNL